MFSACSETVSILYAAIFGAGDACVRIDLWSLGTAFAVFILLVMIAQFAARAAWVRLTRPPAMRAEIEDYTEEQAAPLGRGDTESPIKSSRF